MQCSNCKKTYVSKDKRSKFCSLSCSNIYRETNKAIKFRYCLECRKSFRCQSRWTSKKMFCSNSCSTSYNNKHKRYGIKRSKLEIWLEQELTKLYPNLKIHYNKKDAIGSELDIYIPSLKLAFELNGIFHYEPIFGKDKLDQIQNNDSNKFQACQKLGISLCIIDTSSQKYFKESSSKRFLDIIKKIIDSN